MGYLLLQRKRGGGGQRVRLSATPPPQRSKGITSTYTENCGPRGGSFGCTMILIPLRPRRGGGVETPTQRLLACEKCTGEPHCQSENLLHVCFSACIHCCIKKVL